MPFGGSQPSGTQTVVQQQNTAPWNGQQQYLTTGFNSAYNDVLNRPLQYTPFNQVAPMDPYSNQALTQTANIAGSNQTPTFAGNYINNTLNGQYLNGNPNLQSAIDAANAATVRSYQNAVQPGIDSGFVANGRVGSGAQQAARSNSEANLAQQLGYNATNMSYQNYNDAAQRQMQAALISPQIASEAYLNPQMLNAAGQQYQGQAQNELNNLTNMWNFYQNEPTQRISNYMADVGGNYGQTGTQTTQQPIYGNSALGGLGFGLSAANMLFNPSQGLFPGALAGIF